MYISYWTNQKSVDLVDTTDVRLNTSGGEYRPATLIRTSDWKVVPGNEAKNGYCTLSYCSEQSGKAIKKDNGEYVDITDEGRHCILTRVDKRKAKNYFRSKEKKYVTYEELLQQICSDFSVDYLWYDKQCINKDNKEAKQNELKIMHKIYNNAKYTIALIPEVHVADPESWKQDKPKKDDAFKARLLAGGIHILQSLWWKQSWSLTDVMTSKRILVVGENTHFWQHSLIGEHNNIPAIEDYFSMELLDFISNKKGSVNQVLVEAHFRTSTNPHDRIYTLFNTFPRLFNRMEINCEDDIQITLNNFYRHIAKFDLSILCFGARRSINGSPLFTSTMSDYNLPSWTGVGGRHISQQITTTTLLDSPHFIDDSMQLHMATKYYWKIQAKKYDYGSIYPQFQQNHHKIFDYTDEALLARIKNNGRSQVDLEKTDKRTILVERLADMYETMGVFDVHYFQHKDDPLQKIKLMSLADEECEECFILPVAFIYRKAICENAGGESSSPSMKVLAGYNDACLFPVFKKLPNNTKQYKAIGVMLIEKLTSRDTPLDPDEVLRTHFIDNPRNDEAVKLDEAREFVIV
ncbi:hypothetical protein BDA99DRAFT_590528 [Phascolomyces articulosus]|uniref:Heterokaryon incompatibility domain-containing protein n=1 Tax=Phascolomyces articulosus TaxID=60185 RepID=A0AAD5K041_9FUNG|nr:hypothetical protein BDA99DRAFT_590528 [Phascolomyces articulosus]